MYHKDRYTRGIKHRFLNISSTGGCDLTALFWGDRVGSSRAKTLSPDSEGDQTSFGTKLRRFYLLEVHIQNTVIQPCRIGAKPTRLPPFSISGRVRDQVNLSREHLKFIAMPGAFDTIVDEFTELEGPALVWAGGVEGESLVADDTTNDRGSAYSAMDQRAVP